MGKHRNSDQEQIFAKHIRNAPHILRGDWRADLGWEEMHKLWAQLTADLNKHGPPSKDITGWRRILKDWKSAVLRKVSLRYPLTEVETLIAQKCGYMKTDNDDDKEAEDLEEEAEHLVESLELDELEQYDSDNAVFALNKKCKNPNQELVFLKFVEKHTEMRSDCWNELDKLWIQLAIVLNKSGPPKKDVDNWKKIFKEWKFNVKKKLDNGSGTQVPLTDNDKVLARLFKLQNSDATEEVFTVENEMSEAEEHETEETSLDDNDKFYEGEDEDDCMLSSTLKKKSNVNTAHNDTDLVNLSSWEHINTDQEQVVLKFLDKYPEMRVKNGEKYPAKWDILVSKLNECGPPVRNIRSWKKIILDWKCNVQKMLIPNGKSQKHLSPNDKILASLCGLHTSKVEMDNDTFNGFEFNTTTDFNIKCESELMNVTDTTTSQSFNERKHKNTEQEKYIIKYLEKNPQMVNMKGLCRAERDAIWLELVDKLNCMGPPRKDLISWKKVFVDWRQSLKKKLRRDGKDALFGNEDQFARLNGLYDQFDENNSGNNFGKNLDETTTSTQTVLATEQQCINKTQKKSTRCKSECRTCRINSSMLHKLSEGIPSYPNKTLNDLLIELVQQTDVTEAYMLPQQLCYVCTSKLLNAYDFMVQVRETHTQLLDELKNEDEPFITSSSAYDCLSENPLKLVADNTNYDDIEDVEEMLPKAKVGTRKVLDSTTTEYEDPLLKSFSQDDEVEEEVKEAEKIMEIDIPTTESQLPPENKTATVVIKKSERLRIRSAFSLNKSVQQKPLNVPTNKVTTDKIMSTRSEGLKHKNASQLNKKINQQLKELLESDDDVPISRIKKMKTEGKDPLNKPYLSDEAEMGDNIKINEITKLEIFDDENEQHDEDENLHYKHDDETAKDLELEALSINSDNDEQSCSNQSSNAPITNIQQQQKTDEKFFKCKKCTAQFYWPHNLQYHMRKHQNTESWNSCPYCNRKFYRMDMLKRHVKTHGVKVSPIYSKPAKCPKPKATDVDPNLCAPNGPKQILCMICQRTFNSFSELRTHLLRHPEIDFELCSELVDTLYGYNSNVSKEQFEERLQSDLNLKKLAPYYIIINQAGYELTLDSSETEFEAETQDDDDDEDTANGAKRRNIKLNSYKCELCKSEFSRKYLLFDHQRRDHEWLDAQHVCSRCDGRFLSKQILDLHQRKNCKNASKRFMCTRCPVRFFWRRNLKSHVITHRTTEPLKCPKCERTFAAKHALTKHLYNDHPADKELICCSWCPRKFYRREVFLSHSKRRHGIDELRLPLAETLAQATMDPNGNKDIICKICNEKFERISELREHFLLEMTTHQDYSSFSSYSITNQAGYELHIDDSDTDDENNDPESEIYVKPKRKKNVIVKNMPYNCDLCKIQCMRKYQMMRHQRDLHKFAPSLPYNCDKCVFKTVCKEIFQNHQLYQCDNAEKQNICQICGYKFMWTENLERHLSLQHPEPTLTLKEAAAQKLLNFKNVNKLKCPHCDKTYRLSTCLNNHIRDIHINQKKKYLCITCGWATENRSKLTIHMRYHTGERPYSCHLCDKTYITRFQLTRHIARHDENRDWRCDVCNRVFHTPINLKRHLKTHVTND